MCAIGAKGAIFEKMIMYKSPFFLFSCISNILFLLISKRYFRVLSFFFASFLALVACSDDNDEYQEGSQDGSLSCYYSLKNEGDDTYCINLWKNGKTLDQISAIASDNELQYACTDGKDLYSLSYYQQSYKVLRNLKFTGNTISVPSGWNILISPIVKTFGGLICASSTLYMKDQTPLYSLYLWLSGQWHVISQAPNTHSYEYYSAVVSNIYCRNTDIYLCGFVSSTVKGEGNLTKPVFWKYDTLTGKVETVYVGNFDNKNDGNRKNYNIIVNCMGFQNDGKIIVCVRESYYDDVAYTDNCYVYIDGQLMLTYTDSSFSIKRCLCYAGHIYFLGTGRNHSLLLKVDDDELLEVSENQYGDILNYSFFVVDGKIGVFGDCYDRENGNGSTITYVWTDNKMTILPKKCKILTMWWNE